MLLTAKPTPFSLRLAGTWSWTSPALVTSKALPPQLARSRATLQRCRAEAAGKQINKKNPPPEQDYENMEVLSCQFLARYFSCAKHISVVQYSWSLTATRSESTGRGGKLVHIVICLRVLRWREGRLLS